jgi:hypothetical protein
MTAADIYIQAPPLLTADEARLVLRIGRSNIYDSAKRFLTTDGEDGIPCVRIGRQIRFRRHDLEQITGAPIPWPLVHHDDADQRTASHDLDHSTTGATTSFTTPTESNTTTPTHPSDQPNSTPTLFTI